MAQPQQTTGSLDGRIALVTGGATGLGYAIARECARQGAAVAITSRRESAAKEAAGRIAAESGQLVLPYAMDIRSVDEVRRTVGRVAERFGSLDLLVNNAGVSSPGPALNVEEDQWDLVLNTNLKGAFFAAQAAARVMQQRGGVIVNIASVLGQSSHPGVSPYCISKGGMIQMTRVLAVEWAPLGIRVVAVAPSWVETDLNSTALANEKYRSRILARTPLGALGTPADTASAVAFLASDSARYITGSTLAVDGGWLAM